MHQEIKVHQAGQTAARMGDERGFTIIEVLVSLTLFLIVTGSIYGLLKVARADRSTSSQRIDVLRNLRQSLNVIGRDALDAGYSYQKNGALVPDNMVSIRLGLPNDADTNRDLLVGVVSGNNITTNSLQAVQKTDQISFIYRNASFNNGKTLPIIGVTENPATVPRLTISSAPGVPDNIACSKYDLFLIESQNSSILGVVTDVPTGAVNRKFLRFASAGDPLTLNQPWASTILKPCATPDDLGCLIYPLSIKKVYWVSYKVLSDGTLIRTEFGNNTGGLSTEQIRQMPLAYNVENMQITYVMDDGTVTDDPVAGPDGVRGNADDTPLNLKLVRQVTASITARTQEKDLRTGQYSKITLTSTFSTRNLGYDAG